jgi:hypothetical protein
VVKCFAKCLSHDGTLERCVPLVSQRHTLLSRALNLPKIQFVVLNLDNVTMLVFGSTVLLKSVRARDVVGDANGSEGV